jgi:HTH-type transcriptional regulator/antitoxin MqsA
MSQCHVCSGDRFREEVTSEIFRIGDRLLLVEDIPVMVCDRCGEEVFDRDTMERVRVLLHGNARPNRTVEVGVFSF